MNYANLIQNITENIKTNGSQAITAQVLQDVLVDMVGELGQSGALLGGVIDTSFVPDPTNDAQVVYIAEAPGTYTNFNGLVVGAGEVAFFYFDGNAWAKSSVDVLEVVNDLNSTATDKALSAAMGKQIGDNISQLEAKLNHNENVETTYTNSKGINRANGTLFNVTSGTVTDYIATAPGDVFLYSGKLSNSSYACNAYGYDANKDGVGVILQNTTDTLVNEQVVIPSGVSFVRFDFDKNIAHSLVKSVATDINALYQNASQVPALSSEVTVIEDALCRLFGSRDLTFTEISTTKKQDGFIDLQGNVQSNASYHITNPVAVQKGQFIAIETSAYGTMSAVCFTDSAGNEYKPYSFGFNDYSTHLFALPIIEDGYIAITYISTPKVYKIEANTLVDLRRNIQEETKGAIIEAGGNLIYTDFTGQEIITSSGQVVSDSAVRTTGYVKILRCDIVSHGLMLGHPTNLAVAFYDGDKAFIGGLYDVGTSGGDYTIDKDSIPANTVYARFTAYYNEATFKDLIVSLYNEKKIADNISSIVCRFGRSKNITRRIGTFSNGDYQEISFPNTKWNYNIGVFARVTTMGTLTIKHGDIAYNRGVVSVDGTNISYMTAYNGSGGAVMTSVAHGLTITDYVDIRLEVGTDNDANIIVSTNGGNFKKDIRFFGSYGAVRLENSGGAYTDSVLFVGGDVYDKSVWVFGDSYLDFWPKNTIPDNAEYMLDGYSGRNSSAAISSFRLLKQFGVPNSIVWSMGMNDADSGAINTAWETAFDEVEEYCLRNNIELILVTIPSTPIRDNSYKNAFIRSSGYRYVDIEKAVGADISTSWYTGLLSADNVHPTTDGAKVIADYYMISVPEFRKV